MDIFLVIASRILGWNNHLMTSFTSFSLLESDKNNVIAIKGERINSKIIPETYSNVKLSPNQNKIDVRV